MTQIDKLLARAQTHKGFLDGTEKDIACLRQKLSSKEEELKQLIDHHTDMQWCFEYLDTLVKTESNRFIDKLEDLLNYAVSVIFDDRSYEIKIITDDNKRASIKLCYDEDDNRIEADIHMCGGGIRSVVGIIIQLFMLFHYGVEKILVADEAFSQISSEYLENLFTLLSNLSKSNGLKILLITHDSRVMQYASKRYTIKDGKAIKVGDNN